MRYKVGDIVQIKKELKYGYFYDKVMALPNMVNSGGKKATVVEIVNNSGYILKIAGTVFDCTWTDSMLEDCKETEPVKCQFKINMTVGIKPEMQVGKTYGDILFTNQMELLKEKKLYIVKKIRNDCCYVIDDKGCMFLVSEKMIYPFQNFSVINKSGRKLGSKNEKSHKLTNIQKDNEEKYEKNND